MYESKWHLARRTRMISAALLAWTGMVIHNLADLPISFWSLENTLPGLVWLVLIVIWNLAPDVRWLSAPLLVWGGINTVGAIVTVLPIAWLPFEPEQTWKHYAFHVLYAAGQVPLLLVAWSELRPQKSRVWT